MRKEGDMLKFKGYCVENGIKQTEIADLLNLSLSVVNQKMNGRLDWTLEQVRTLCRHFKISADIYFV